MERTTFKQQLLANVLLPLGDLLTRQKVMQSYRFFRDAQWWPFERLVEYQEQRLRETIKTAYTEVPFYRNLYDRYRVKIDEIRTKTDLVNIPPVSKDDLRKAYPKYCTRKTGYPVCEFFTSGSSGQPFAVKIDSRTLSDARALMLLRANFSGWEIGEPLLQTGMTLNRGIVKLIKDFLLGIQYVSAFDLSDETLDKYLRLIEKENLKYVMGYPASIYFLAKRARQIGFNCELKGIVCWGDNLYSHYRHEMEEVFGCSVTDTYGCGEGIQIAAQCKYGLYHIFMPHVIVEVVDKHGLPVQPGCTGDILLTRLDAGVMPLIRYRVGDVGRILSQRVCRCARGFEIMAGIDGRDSDIIVTPRGNRLIVHFFTGIFEYYPSIDSFKVVQEEPGCIYIMVVPGENFRDEILDQVKREIWEKGDPELKIFTEIVEEIPLEVTGKRRFVVSKLNENLDNA